MPYYSITEWNLSRGHPDVRNFEQDDYELYRLVDEVTFHINMLNSRLGTYSPKFNKDLEKTKKGRRSGKMRNMLNLKLLRDGVHPGFTLAKVWKKNITKVIRNECYR